MNNQKLNLTINYIITSLNMNHLKKLINQILPFNNLILKFSIIKPKKTTNKLFNTMIPKISNITTKIIKTITYKQKQNTNLTFTHNKIPLYLLPNLKHLYNNLKTHNFTSITKIYEPNFYPIDNTNYIQTKHYTKYKLSKPYIKLYKKYNTKFNNNKLKPINILQSNSFNYIYEQKIP